MTILDNTLRLIPMEYEQLQTMPERVKFARKDAGFKSQTKIADVMGITRDAYAWYETTADMPTEHLEKFHKATKFQIHWLVTGDGPMKSDQEDKNKSLHNLMDIAREAADREDDPFASETLKMLMERKRKE